MKDQEQYWNKAHAEAILSEHSKTHTEFAKEAAGYLKAGSNILELGCGEGNDSIYFAQLGHTVTATDFSNVVIERNKQHAKHANLLFLQQDTGQPLQFKNEEFDAVYARLSLHYFTDAVTKKIFAEIARVLKPGGTLLFMCKSVEDRLFGKGVEIEPNMFDLDGHVRHFFSAAYARELLKHDFTTVSLRTGHEDVYGKPSGFVKVVATKN
ncbi:MAG TPA: class I SAM-dependent methyltransferase [Candidatus Saccharimonadales bacterium]|nr:class I SAM-dependent methyltransferase [Candidatus Saccharimonadales bacterium]